MVYLWLFFFISIVAIGYIFASMGKATDIFHKEFRSKRSGFPDLLRYDHIVGKGIILGKGGELMATYKYRGPDTDCASPEEMNLLRKRVSDMITSMRSGWMIHSNTLRKESMEYPDSGAFPDAVTRAIETERKSQYKAEGSHYENEYFITFTFLPDLLLVSKIKDFAIDSESKKILNSNQMLKKTIQLFENQLTDYVSALQNGLSENLVRLGAKQERDQKTLRLVWYDDQLSFFHECITGISQPIRLPAKTIPTGVNYLIGSYPFLTGMRPKLDDKYLRVIAIETPPHEGTYFGILEILNRLPVQYRWSTRWISRDPEAVKAEVGKIRSKWRQKIRGFIADMRGKTDGAVNTDALNMSNDAEAVINDINEGVVSYGQWTSNVVLYDADPGYLNDLVAYVLKQIRDAGFTCRDESVNCTEAYLGTLPGHGYENLRQPMVHSMNLADTMPLTSTWQGPIENKCEFYKKFYGKNPVPPLFYGAASGNTPFRVVLHNGDIGHTLIIGPTGAGKSTVLGLIAASQFRYPNAKVFAFDKDESMLALCLGAGGNHYNFMDEKTANSASIGFSPFSHIQRLNERIWACDYVESIMQLHGVEINLDRSAEISKAMELLATRPIEMRTFTDLSSLIQTRQIRQVLSFYENEGAGGMLNHKADSITTSRFTVFELGHLMEMGEKHIVPVLLYLFRMVERALDGSPTIIPLDEAWLMLRHKLFEEKLKTWLKVLRKANAAVIFATQELQDINNSPIGPTIFSACQTKILLPNAEAKNLENADLYRKIGLTDREIELLAYATPKRDYFFKSPAGRRKFSLELGPVALAFVGASGVDDRAIIKKLYDIHGSNYVHHWLRHRSINPAILDTVYKEQELLYA